MLLVHKLIGTWSKKVTAYIALTEFQKQKMIDGGLPADKIFVKPNFTQFDDESLKFEENRQPPLTSTSRPPTSQRYALFVGRLSFEKGCDVLIHAWTQFQQAWREAHAAPASAKESPQLLIVGDGPERESIEALTSILQQSATVHFAGRKPMSEVLELMRAAGFLVQPSVLYEGFPMTIVEAFSQGCPVIAAGQGGMAEALQDGGGLLFKPSDSESLSEKMTWSFMHPAELKQMGEKARRNFKAKYSAEVNYLELMEIYQAALKDLPC
jgi:glycosyltransferase involved in cell wall biosynthesis